MLRDQADDFSVCTAHPSCPGCAECQLRVDIHQYAKQQVARKASAIRNTVPGRKDCAAWETASPKVAKKKKTVRVTWCVPLLMGPSPEAVAVMKLYMTCTTALSDSASLGRFGFTRSLMADQIQGIPGTVKTACQGELNSLFQAD